MGESSGIMVSVVCLTYNHAAYVRDCLEGFVSQKTTFPVEVLIHDDASTDGTQQIIKEYESRFPDLFRVVYQTENQFSKGVRPWDDVLFPMAQGKYVAWCEGDDYWTDPLKLQKQVDFLEAHPDYVMCCSDAVISSPAGELDWCRYGHDTEVPARDIISGGGDFLPTASLMLRTELVRQDYPKCSVGDYPLQILAAISGKVHWFAQKQVVYRYHAAGSWTSTVSRSSVQKRIPMLLSEFEMLRQMDVLSGGCHSAAFQGRVAAHLIYIICLYRDDYPMLADVFREYIPYLSMYQRFKLFLVRYRLFFILDAVKWVGRKVQGR